MGNTLPAPKRDKESAEGSFGPKFGYALSDMQGWRLTMEDAYIVEPNFVPDEKETHLVGVFDGHGGSEVAKFCSNHFGKHLWQLESYKQGNYALALKECFHLMDVLLQKEENFEEIVNYRAQTLTEQFDILCDIIIGKRTNKFTLTQLQDLLDQANFFSVPLTIKPELITALEELTAKQKAAQEAQQKAEQKAKKKLKPKPKKPKKPSAPKEPKLNTKKGTRLARMFTRTKRGEKKKKKENHRLKSIESDWSDDEEDRNSKSKSIESKSREQKEVEQAKKDMLEQAEKDADRRLNENNKQPLLKKKSSRHALFMVDDTEPINRETPRAKTNPFGAERPKFVLGQEPVPNNRTFGDMPPGMSSITSEPPGLKSTGSQPPGFKSFAPEPPGLKSTQSDSPFGSIGSAPPGFGSVSSLPPGMEKPAPPKKSEKTDSGEKDTDDLSEDPFADDPIEVNDSGQIVVIQDNKEIPLDDKEHTSVAEISASKPYKAEKKHIMRSIRLTNSNKGRKLKTNVFSHSQMSMKSEMTLEDLENGAYSQQNDEEVDDLEPVRRKVRVKKRVKRSRTKVTEGNTSGELAETADPEVEEPVVEPEVEEPVVEAEPVEPEPAETKAAPEEAKETPKPLPEGQFITSAGCTAITALFRGSKIYVANIGDSRAVMSRAGKAFALSEDHKPTAPKEKARIYAAGGIINAQGRINGDLNLSRCVGDLRFKTQKHLSPAEQIVTAEADVETFDIIDSDQFIVFACDGVWDVMTSQEVISFVLHKITSGESSLKKIAEQLLDNCISEDLVATKGLGGDNMTCVIIRLQPMAEIQRFKMNKKLKKNVRKIVKG